MSDKSQLPCLGWREWVSLPQLGVDAIKVKVDTGARTSALHAFALDLFERAGELWVRIGLHPKRDQTELFTEARVVDQRVVRDSGGHEEMRPVIRTQLQLGGHRFEAEITLTCRDNMRFRMLLGRKALEHRFLVNPQASYLQSRRPGAGTTSSLE